MPSRPFRRACRVGWALLAACALAGCESDPWAMPGDAGPVADAPTPARSGSPIVAYLDGQPLRRDALWPALTEASGQTVFDEFVLDAALRRRLERRGLTLAAPQIADELSRLSDALSDDPDQAARLLVELRQRRGLGDDRFDRLLRRNAGLRLLVREDAELEPAQLEAQARRAFVREFGPTFRVRLLTADTPGRARQLRERVLRGEAFADVAATASTDVSRAQGGLLAPINPLDTTYPQVLRDALPKLDPAINAGLSPILALPGGYAVVQLLEAIPARDVAYEDVRNRLLSEVRRGNQRLLMEQLARALRDETDVLVTDRELGRAWKR